MSIEFMETTDEEPYEQESNDLGSEDTIEVKNENQRDDLRDLMESSPAKNQSDKSCKTAS